MKQEREGISVAISKPSRTRGTRHIASILNSSRQYTKPLKALLSSPSLIAFGLDPESASAHLYIKTDLGEIRRKLPMGPDARLLFDLLKGMVSRYL